MFENEDLEVTAPVKSYSALARTDKVRLIYRQAPPALAISILVAALWIALMWGAAKPAALLVWVAVLIVATVIRFALLVSYFGRKPTDKQALRWEAPFVLSLIPAVATWGVGCVMAMPTNSMLHQVITFTFLIGMSAMAISAYGILPRLAVAVVIILVAPVSLAFFLQGERTLVLLGVSGVVFLLSTSRSLLAHGSALFEYFRLRHELQDAYRVSDHHASTDSLTGILNRRAFLSRSAKVLSDCVQQGESSTMILLDVDDFKRINDVYGHASGDAALQKVVQTLETCFRASDPCGRIGGDEFAIFLPGTPVSQARLLAEKLLQTIAESTLRLGSEEITIGLSMGLASDSIRIEELLQRADSAMYAAKRKGKNQIAEFDASPDQH